MSHKKPTPAQARKAAAKARTTRNFLERIRREDAQLNTRYQMWLRSTVAAIYLDAWSWENDPQGVGAFTALTEVQALPRPPRTARGVYRAQLQIAIADRHKASAIWKATESMHLARLEPIAFEKLLLTYGVYKAAEHYRPSNDEGEQDKGDDPTDPGGGKEDASLDEDDLPDEAEPDLDESASDDGPNIGKTVALKAADQVSASERLLMAHNTARLELFIKRDRVKKGDVIIVAIDDVLDEGRDFQSLTVTWEYNF